MVEVKDTRTRLLDAALSLFYEQGYHAATTKAMAERAGVNEVTLFRHFGSKENVFCSVIERETDITRELEEFDLELVPDYVTRHDRAEEATRAGRRPEPQPARRVPAQYWADY